MNTPVVLAAVNDIVDRLDSLSREEVTLYGNLRSIIREITCH